jgi:hypothetical protein
LGQIINMRKLRDELLNREISDRIRGISVVIRRWRKEYKKYRAQNSLEKVEGIYL